MAREKAEIEILHARMIVFVGCTIAITFAITVIGFVYGNLLMAVLPANPKVIGSKPYHGNSDGAAAGPRAGMDEWIRQAIKHADGGLWNNGSYGVRSMRGSENLSVHATGRAVDLSYRASAQHPRAKRATALTFLDIVLANANTLGVECVLDYIAPFGRGWRCDRQKWRKHT
jgi:hypothetical protein